MVFSLGLPVPVVFPIRLCPADVFWLAFLRATRQQNDQPVAVPPEVNAVAGAKINLVFENAVTNRFDVGQVTIRNPLKGRRYFAAACTLSARSHFVKGLRPAVSMYSRTSSTIQ
jgi:hypothetical protein